ncbi:MAG: hypothetical protein JSS83_08320 [Cyanobacteria bacterium SZAS LIN-3]|nr:hypothetical protein [Cyanobacteria bacterium SZAS LIN-3]
MNGMAKFIAGLIVIDTFFVSFAVGFNSKHVLVVDPSLPAYVPPVVKPAVKGEPALVEPPAAAPAAAKPAAKSGPARAEKKVHAKAAAKPKTNEKKAVKETAKAKSGGTVKEAKNK